MHTIGIDLGGTTLSAGLVNHTGKIILRRTVDTEHSSGEAIIGQLCELVRSLCAGSASAEAVQVGIAIPGWVDAVRGQVVTWNHRRRRRPFSSSACGNRTHLSELYRRL